MSVALLPARVFAGETLRWYLKSARHPLKNYLVGHYWKFFCALRVWVRYDGDLAIRVRLGDYVQQRIFFDDYYERPLVNWLKETLRPDDVFWDVGGNVGAIALVAARHCRQVVAFEPDPRSADALARNVEANGLGNVIVQRAALGDSAGQGTLYRASRHNSGMTSLLPGRTPAVDAIDIQVETADAFVARHEALAPTIVKLDVEGAEHLVVKGARNCLRRPSLRAIVFEDRCGPGGRPMNAALVADLEPAGFAIAPLGRSSPEADDDLMNFCATRT